MFKPINVHRTMCCLLMQVSVTLKAGLLCYDICTLVSFLLRLVKSCRLFILDNFYMGDKKKASSPLR